MIENFSRKKLSLLLIMALSYTISPAQVSVELKSEYIGKSSYRFMENEKSEKVGDSKGAHSFIKAVSTYLYPLSSMKRSVPPCGH